MKTAFTRLLWTLATAACCAGACTSSSGSKADAGGTGGATGKDGASDGSGQVASQVVNNGLVTTGPWTGYGFTATDPGAAQSRPIAAAARAACRRSRATRSACRGLSPAGRTTAASRCSAGTSTRWTAARGNLANPGDGRHHGHRQQPRQHATPLATARHRPAQRHRPLVHPAHERPARSVDQLVTNCYTGGTPQTPLTAGTPIQQASILVPGLQTDLPFSLCLVDVGITP